MTEKKALRRKIEKNLRGSKESIPFFKYGNQVYFHSVSGYLVSLPQSYFFERLSSLREYFENREPKQAQKLILENLSIFAQRFNDKEELIPKIEIVYDSCFCTVFKISNYPESEDCQDVNLRTLRSMRGEELNNNSEWNSSLEREDPRIMAFAHKILRWLRGD